MDPPASPGDTDSIERPVRPLIAAGLALAGLGGYLLTTEGPPIPAAVVAAFGLLQALAGLSAKGLAMRWLSASSAWLDISLTQVILIANGIALSVAARAASGDGPLVASPLAAPLWLAGIALVVGGCWAASGEGSPLRWTRAEVAVVGLLTLAALAVRAWGIGRMPYVLSGDEGSAGLTAWEFVAGGRDNVLALGWFSFPALYFGLLSASQAIFGRTAEAIRLVSAVAGALTIPALYALARQMFSRPAALAAAAWLAAFHLHVFFSRLAYNNVFDGLLFVLAAGGLWQGWRHGRRSAFIFAGLAVGFSQFFYTTGRLTPLILALWTVLLAIDRRPDRTRLAGLVAAGLVASAVFLPLGLLYTAHPEQLFFTASRVSILIPGWTAEAAAALGTTAFGLVLEQIWVTALGLTIAELQGVYYAPGVPMLISLSAVLFFGGLALCLVHLRQPRYSLWLLVLAGTILAGGLSIQAPNSQRLLYLAPALALIVVLPFDAAWTWSAPRWPDGRAALLALGGLMLTVAMAQNLDSLFGRYFPREEYGSRNGAVTQEMIAVLPALPEGTPVYFFGGDRMGFTSIPNLAYLLPDAQGVDLASVEEIPGEGYDWIAIVLPEQVAVWSDLRERFPEGTALQRYNRRGRTLFYIWAVGDPASALTAKFPQPQLPEATR